MRAVFASFSIAPFLLAAGNPTAAPKGDTTLYSTRGAPLATVAKNGAIRSAKCGPGFSEAAGNRKGDVWTRLDAWGRPAERVHVTGSSVYDLRNCREIGTRGGPDTGDAPALYVRGARAPSPTRPFSCSATHKHAALASSFRATVGVSSPPAIFCTRDARGNELMHAIAGGKNLVLARFENGHWTLGRKLRRAPTDVPTPADEAYVVVAVLDMNGDGAPEIVVHTRGADSYDDDVYTLRADGRLHLVATQGSGYA